MTDYEDLAFEPKMTWEELCEFASKYDKYSMYKYDRHFTIWPLRFHDNGIVEYMNEWGENELAKNRTYEQMKAIIENLFNEVK